MSGLPSLSVLRSFEAAARHQSFTLAAQDLRVTQGAVSRMVRELEGLVGVALFRPAGRGVALTEAGRTLSERLHGDLDRLRQTMRNASAAGDGMQMLSIGVQRDPKVGRTQMLSIGVLPTFGSRWLAPRLERFRREQPTGQFAIHSRSKPFDLAADGIDLAIHFGRKEWVNGALTDLCPEDLVAVASPGLAARHAVAGATDLARLPLLHLHTRHTAWEVYFDGLGQATDRARRGAMFDQFSTMISAAIHGLGAAIVPTYLIEAELAQGTLVELGRPPSPDGQYYIVTPRGVANPAAAAFRDWIVGEVRTSTRTRALRLSDGN